MLLQDFTENVKQISSYSMYGIILFHVLAERDGGRDEENGCKCSYRNSIVEKILNDWGEHRGSVRIKLYNYINNSHKMFAN